MLKKLNTWFWYFYEYMKYGDFRSVFTSAKYLIFKKSHKKDRLIKTSLGHFFCRKGTNDFQFANFRYEWGVKSFILNHIHQYNVFIDGGSCVGIYPILLSKYNIRSIAFEPVPENYKALVKNLQLNHLEHHVKSFQVGLGNENKIVRFKLNKLNTGASHLDRTDDPGSTPVKICTFDSLLNDLHLDKGDRILFKLDVEGMETEALKGAADFIRNYPNLTIILEEKFTGKERIIPVLNELGTFEYGMVDQYNMFARKIKISG